MNTSVMTKLALFLISINLTSSAQADCLKLLQRFVFTPAVSTENLTELGYSIDIARKLVALRPDLAKRILRRSAHPIKLYRGLKESLEDFDPNYVMNPKSPKFANFKGNPNDLWVANYEGMAIFFATHLHSKVGIVIEYEVPIFMFKPEEGTNFTQGKLLSKFFPDHNQTPFIRRIGFADPENRIHVRGWLDYGFSKPR